MSSLPNERRRDRIVSIGIVVPLILFFIFLAVSFYLTHLCESDAYCVVELHPILYGEAE